MVSIVLNITLWVLTILGFVIYNLYSKNIKLEKMIVNQNQTLSEISSVIDQSDKIIHDLDKLGAFKSDDEIGFFFKTVKEIQDLLNQYSTTRK